MKRVIIAEKPSVAKNIADALGVKSRNDGYFEGEEYLITWAFGHLLQLYDAKDYDENMKKWELNKFPFIPDEFKYKVRSAAGDKSKVDPGAKKQIDIIKSLIDRDDVSDVISATDFDREGQLIADEIFLYLKEKKPVYRILLNEWTPNEVKKGMQALKPNDEMKSLQDAGMSRQWADWLIGINLTSTATVKYYISDNKMLNVGRVLLPTLKIIYDRDMEIKNFEATTYYKLLTKFKTDKGDIFESTYYEKDKEGKQNEKFDKKEYLEDIKKLIAGKQAKVVSKEVEHKNEYAPLLFNLSNLQGYITSKYKGWTSDKVLKVAQSLYEKKHITYPRTGSMALEESLKERTQNVLQTLKKGLSYEDQIKFTVNKRIFDNSKVESHSAIVPTYIKPKSLSSDEQIVYDAVKNRFLMQFMPVAEFEETKIVSKIEDEPKVPGEFISRGKVQLVLGWQVIEKPESKDTVLPQVAENELLGIEKIEIKTVTRKPPKPHTEKTLLKIMETCGKSFKNKGKNASATETANAKDNNDEGDEEEQVLEGTTEASAEEEEKMMQAILSGFSIGTPATRAETIKKLKDIGYVQTKGKSLVCTQLGINMVENFPVRELFDLEYTGKLEKTLSDIEKGKYQKSEFIDMIKTFTTSAVNTIKNDRKNIEPDKRPRSTNADGTPISREVLGKCPICGGDVVENKAAFGCKNWKEGCKYTIWKNDKFIASLGKRVTPEMIKLLLQNNQVGFKKLRGAGGKEYPGYLKFTKNEASGEFEWSIEPIE